MEFTMKTIAISPVVRGVGEGSEKSFLRIRRRWSTLLLIGTTAGILTGLSGLILAGASLLRFISPFSGLGILGTVLLISTFPVLIFQAHCLERLEDANRAERVASYRRLVYGDETSSVD